MYVTTRQMPVPVALLTTPKGRVLVLQEGSLSDALLKALRVLLRNV